MAEGFDADAPAPGTLRLDKWLWQARFVKSRSLAAKLCQSGTLRVDGARIGKAHFAVKPGHTLTFPLHNHIRVIRVLALGERRGPASEARLLYEDLDPPRADNALPRNAPPASPSPGGKPDRRQRRALQRLQSPGR